MKAKKSLGQNFLIDKNYINRIIASINVFSDDLIIEIGAGHGALTRELQKKGSEVVAYEIDQDLMPDLKKIENNKTTIINQDFLKVAKLPASKGKIIIVGNLPYYITTPIIEHIINIHNSSLKYLVIMVQKEVANRFLAQPHSKDYGYFTVWLQHFFTITKITDVPRTAFSPAPKVESTVLKLTLKDNDEVLDLAKYQITLKKCFRQKRKQLKNNFSKEEWAKIVPILEKNKIALNIRAEELDDKIFKEISQIM